MKNPNWHRDEIILALDLYFASDRGPIDRSNLKIIELSKILNALPFHLERPDPEKFRNPNGVGRKLVNFLAIDPSYHGKGGENYSKLDEIIFHEFYNNREQLKNIAQKIREIVKKPAIRSELWAIEEDEQTLNDSVPEGQILYKLHKVIERNFEIIKRKKKQALKLYGKLVCEACSFNFEEFYGPIGKDFIECHHRTPLATLKATTETSLEDLALVCANCHRILHRGMNKLKIADLQLHIRHLKADDLSDS